MGQRRERVNLFASILLSRSSNLHHLARIFKEKYIIGAELKKMIYIYIEVWLTAGFVKAHRNLIMANYDKATISLVSLPRTVTLFLSTGRS